MQNNEKLDFIDEMAKAQQRMSMAIEDYANDPDVKPFKKILSNLIAATEAMNQDVYRANRQ